MARLMEMEEKSGFVLGAGAGPFHVLGMNSEPMPNSSYRGEEVTKLTHYAEIDKKGGCVCEKISSGDCGLMANLFGTDGSPGKVIKVVARIRAGGWTSLRLCKRHCGPSTASGRSVWAEFLSSRRAGRDSTLCRISVKGHSRVKTREEVNEWLRYFDMSAPLACLSVFHSYDPGLDLRVEHTHCFPDHNESGHCHGDTTPDGVEYEANFNVPSVLYRIDRSVVQT
jgi:Domain of Unknown Function (DUF1907)